MEVGLAISNTSHEFGKVQRGGREPYSVVLEKIFYTRPLEILFGTLLQRNVFNNNCFPFSKRVLLVIL